jgi:UV DNA damage endonuclease|tara:strand:+ start:1848 stop:2990 length:1143 start_codon:yes stop_codon:yes gene_type:complete
VGNKYTYGLVCISEKLKKQDKSLAFKTMTRKSFLHWREKHSDGKNDFTPEVLLEGRILHNLELTSKILKHCAINDIFHYRLSSKLFPLITDTTLNLSIENFSNFNSIKVELKTIGEIAKKHGILLSIHPDQFNVLASKRSDVVQKTIMELNFHAKIMDMIGLPKDYSAPINIHPSVTIHKSTQEEKTDDEGLREIVDKFYEGFKQCNEGVRNRLVVENEDKGCWNCANLFMYFHNYCGTKHGHFFPLTYDNLHDYCNPSSLQEENVTQEQNVQAFAGTWKKDVPVFHYSWGREDKFRSHADFAAENIPDYDMEITWECELKQKDYAIERLQNWKDEIKSVPKPKLKPKKQESPEVLKNLEPIDKQDAVYTAYNHVYGINM